MGAKQMHKPVGHHLAAPVQTHLKRIQTADSTDRTFRFFGSAKRRERLAVGLIVLLPQETAIGDSVPKGAYAQLQRAAICD